jgi:outer membrane immunogenic protein
MRSLVFSLLVAVLLASPALAQSPFSEAMSRFEVNGGLDYLRASRIDACCFSLTGFHGGFAFNRTENLGLVLDFGRVSTKDINQTGQSLKLTTIMGGPRLNLRGGKFTPFGQLLGGIASGSSNFTLNNGSAWAVAFGGGIDVPIKSSVSWRVIELDDLVTHIKNGAQNSQNNIRISTGIVCAFGSTE